MTNNQNEGGIEMKKNLLEYIYDQIKDNLDPIGKGYDANSSLKACEAVDLLKSNEKKQVCEEIRAIASKAGTNSVYYDKSAYIANLIQFHAETWEKNQT